MTNDQMTILTAFLKNVKAAFSRGVKPNAEKKVEKNEGIIREPQRRCRNFAVSLKTKAARPSTTKTPPARNENIIQSKR